MLKNPLLRKILNIMSWVLLVGILAGLLEIFLPFGPFDHPESVDAQSLETFNVLAHAMGGIDGIRYSNSMEAFESNYSKGFKVFEVDFILTADGKVVAAHDNLAGSYGFDKPIFKLTADEFKRGKYREIYTALSLEDVISLLVEYPDVVLVPDVKSDFRKTFEVIVKTVRERDPALLQRIIPQIYSIKDYDILKDLHDFDRIIFTLYRLRITPRSKIINCFSDRKIRRFISDKEDIIAVTMFRLKFNKSGWLVREIRAMNRDILVHTLNDEKEINRYLGLGATGIYTDEYSGWLKK